jgi:hypothetical protein
LLDSLLFFLKQLELLSDRLLLCTELSPLDFCLAQFLFQVLVITLVHLLQLDQLRPQLLLRLLSKLRLEVQLVLDRLIEVVRSLSKRLVAELQTDLSVARTLRPLIKVKLLKVFDLATQVIQALVLLIAQFVLD